MILAYTHRRGTVSEGGCCYCCVLPPAYSRSLVVVVVIVVVGSENAVFEILASIII